MFTLTPYEVVFDGLLVITIIVLSITVYHLQKHRPQSVRKEKKNYTRSGRDMEIGNQAGRDVIIKEKSKPCKREMFYFSQAKDLQKTLTMALNDKAQLTERYDREFLRMQAINEKLQEENDALWDENTRLKYEKLENRFPVLFTRPEPATPETKVA